MGRPLDSLVKSLEKESDTLTEQSMSFQRYMSTCRVLSFYETVATNSSSDAAVVGFELLYPIFRLTRISLLTAKPRFQVCRWRVFTQYMLTMPTWAEFRLLRIILTSRVLQSSQKLSSKVAWTRNDVSGDLLR